MEPIGSSETSASNTQTSGIYPKESRLLISNISSDRISVNLNLITGCLIQFPGRIAIPNDVCALNFSFLISARALVMQPKLMFTTLMSLFLLLFRSKAKQNEKLQNAISCYFASFKCVMLRSSDFRLAAECDVSFTLSGQHVTTTLKWKHGQHKSQKYKFLCILKSVSWCFEVGIILHSGLKSYRKFRKNILPPSSRHNVLYRTYRMNYTFSSS